MRSFQAYRKLCRGMIALFSAGSAVTGMLLSAPAFTARTALLAAGVFLLACGASALNQYQERDIDARMERTRRRPLPAGAIEPGSVLRFSVLLLAAGASLLLPLGPAAFLLGAAAVGWYNGIYTPLKRLTAFASVWGAPVGMLPPAIGWAAGNGSMTDPRLFLLAVFFFLWQVPHFWLLLRCGGEYERAGLPSIMRFIPPRRLAALSAVWFASAAAVSLAFPLFGMVRAPVLFPLLLLSALGMSGAATLAVVRRTVIPAVFVSVNAFLLVLMVLVSADAVTGGMR